MPFSEECKALGDLFLKYARPLIIWKQRKSEGPKLPYASLKSRIVKVEHQLQYPVPTKPEDCVFITDMNRPVQKWV